MTNSDWASVAVALNLLSFLFNMHEARKHRLAAKALTDYLDQAPDPRDFWEIERLQK